MRKTTSVNARWLAIALVLSALIAAVPPTATAAEPQPAAWSPYRAPAAVKAVALAWDAGTVAAATDAPQTGVGGIDTSDPGGTAAAASPSDLVVLDVADGHLYNGTGSDVPNGRFTVAVSDDGQTVVSAGRGTGRYVMDYHRIAGDSSQFGTKAAKWSLALDGPPAGVAVSQEGRRAAVAVNAPGGGRVIVLDDSKTQIMSWTGPVHLTSVSMSSDGQWVVAAGREEVSSTLSVGAIYLLRYPSSDPAKRYLMSENATQIESVRMAADGSAFAALTKDGRVLAFKNAGAATRAPAVLGEADANATARALTISGDGRIVGAAIGKTLTVAAFDGASLSAKWSHEANEALTSVSANRDGDVIVAGVGGVSGAVLAFSPASSEPYWRVGGGATTNVTVNAVGDWVAYAQGSRVHARQLVHNLQFLFETGPGIGVPTAPSAASEPFRPITFATLVTNDGSLPESVVIEQPVPRDVTVSLNRTHFDLLPGEHARVSITVTPGRLPPGQYSFNVTAVSEGTGHRANLTVPFTVTPTSDVSVTLNGAPERRTKPGGNDSILLSLVNNGNSASAIAVDVRQIVSTGSEWQVRLVGENQFSLAPGGFGSVRVLVDVPWHAVNGSTNLITVNVRSGQSVVPTDVLYHVNPFVSVNLTGPGGVRILPKFLFAGDSVQFNLTVKNTGSVSAQFQAAYLTPTVTSEDPNWVVEVDLSPFPLAPGQNRTLPVIVHAPKGALVGDRLSVTVEARNVPLDDATNVATENVTLFAQVQERPPKPEVQNQGVPGPGAIFAALAALGVAYSTRRRNR